MPQNKKGFPTGTTILMDDYSAKAIEHLEAGDHVLTPFGARKVVNKISCGSLPVQEIMTTAGDERGNGPRIRSTASQAYGVCLPDETYEFVSMDSLLEGQKVLIHKNTINANFEYRPTTIIHNGMNMWVEFLGLGTPTEEEIYTLEIEEVNCFYADGFMVRHSL